VGLLAVVLRVLRVHRAAVVEAVEVLVVAGVDLIMLRLFWETGRFTT
jgi:hypothetical protein